MKKNNLIASIYFIVVIFSGFKKAEPPRIDKFTFVNPLSHKYSISEVNLTVTCLTNRTQPLGGSFQHKVRLMNGTNPFVNAEVKINDPIGRICTWVTTNTKGEAIWTRTIPLNINQQVYTIEFFYGNVRQYSTVAIEPPSDAISLPSYSINLNSADFLDNRTLVMASRGGFKSTSQTINTTLQETKKIGLAIISDYLSNPVSKEKAILMVVSCSATPFVGPLAGKLCLHFVDEVALGLIGSDIKLMLYKGIEATNFSPVVKITLKKMLELGTIAISVAKLNPAEGLSKLDALEAGYDFVKNVYGQLVSVDGLLKGASFPAQKAGSSEVYMMCIYNRDSSKQIVTQTSKDPNCKENNTGDYCFQNTTKLDLEVRLMSSPSKIFSYTSPFICTLQSGQKQCFFNVPAGVARYEIRTPATITINSYGSATTLPKTYLAEGSLYVEACHVKIFNIK